MKFTFTEKKMDSSEELLKNLTGRNGRITVQSDRINVRR